jgi:hypothetical protein
MKIKRKEERTFGDRANPPTPSLRMTALQLRRHMCQPIERKQLTSCLKLLGLWPIPAWSGGYKEYQRTFRRGRNSPTMKQLSLNELYDLRDLARKQWLALYKKFQVQTGRNHGIGVWLNAFWAHVKKYSGEWALNPAAADPPAGERVADSTSADSVRPNQCAKKRRIKSTTPIDKLTTNTPPRASNRALGARFRLNPDVKI